MQSLEHATTLCPIVNERNPLGYSIPALLRERVHLRGEVFGVANARVLVVGDSPLAVGVALELFTENDVCLLSMRSDLEHLGSRQRVLLNELVAEDELELLRGARIQHLAATAKGGCEVLFGGSANWRECFDHIFEYGRDLQRSCRVPEAHFGRNAG